ncbi:SAM-dependent chlorinase/fluorinase [Flavobacterium sp. CYK-55]|uniref:SAM hydrolase/SAM-dependent halogenase family protein n=1 Tax=Flavobacterium sp. CYK-55 TaxID=2835529 RepID=UPI001BCADCCE|nr:SAM-dependent chlorinase/fluorinase [Flavobacterium sp. CYK-55]MBS7788272.1 SAM-dependent chlorinase/fluorinase [Flavobacterium sp. CYK-55]
MSIITLTTDYGLKDHFVGALKGKVLSQFPEAVVVDLSHGIEPFNILQASYMLNAAYKAFPKGTVHLIGVDAERNVETQHLVIEWDNHYFIAADNGLLTMLTQHIKPQKMVEITIHDRLPSEATDLDVLVTVACHIAKGGALSVIGKETTQIKQVTELQPQIADDLKTIRGSVIYIDHFGNVVTNISQKLFLEVAKGRPYQIPLKAGKSQRRSSPIKNIWAKYSDILGNGTFTSKDYEGEKLAIFNEAGFLEIAIFKSNPMTVGSASTLLGLSYRDTVLVEFL